MEAGVERRLTIEFAPEASPLDGILPAFDVRSSHTIAIAAPAARVWATLRRTDFGRLLIPRVLLALRTLPALLTASRATYARLKGRGAGTALTLDAMMQGGFCPVAEEPGRWLVLGAVGRFWRPEGEMLKMDAEDFRRFAEPGYARAAWSFQVEPLGEGRTLLRTETRVLCSDDSSRRLFRLYWLVVGPFSGLIRRAMLWAVRRGAEPPR